MTILSTRFLPALIIFGVLPSTVTAQQPLRLGDIQWSDEFDSDGALNPSSWSYDLGSSGWGNEEVQDYTDTSNNVLVQDGVAQIKVKKTIDSDGNNQFSSARIRTSGKVEFQYGSVEARIKLPNLANGLWPAFWLLGSNFYNAGWPFCGEIDILEAGSGGAISTGNVNEEVSSAAHWDVDGQYASYARSIDTGSDFSDKWQVFRMDWTDSVINTFVDGQFIWAFDIGSCKDTHCAEFHQPFFFIANVAVGGRFTGILDRNSVTALTPAQMEIDYIRIYDNESINAQVTIGGILQTPRDTTPSPISQSTPSPTTPAATPSPTPNPTVATTPSPTTSNNGGGTIDCGVPATCTSAVLDADAGGVSCRDHITWLMDVRGRNELYACDSVARKSFPAECGGCDPGTGKPFINYSFDCGAPQLCNDNVLNHDAPELGPTCGERISHLIEVDGKTEDEACAQVAGAEFPSECGECVHDVITCGKPDGHACFGALDQVSNEFTCRERISWVVYATHKTELEACEQVASEAANAPICGPCHP